MDLREHLLPFEQVLAEAHGLEAASQCKHVANKILSWILIFLFAGVSAGMTFFATRFWISSGWAVSSLILTVYAMIFGVFTIIYVHQLISERQKRLSIMATPLRLVHATHIGNTSVITSYFWDQRDWWLSLKLPTGFTTQDLDAIAQGRSGKADYTEQDLTAAIITLTAAHVLSLESQQLLERELGDPNSVKAEELTSLTKETVLWVGPGACAQRRMLLAILGIFYLIAFAFLPDLQTFALIFGSVVLFTVFIGAVFSVTLSEGFSSDQILTTNRVITAFACLPFTRRWMRAKSVPYSTIRFLTYAIDAQSNKGDVSGLGIMEQPGMYGGSWIRVGEATAVAKLFVALVAKARISVPVGV